MAGHRPSSSAGCRRELLCFLAPFRRTYPCQRVVDSRANAAVAARHSRPHFHPVPPVSRFVAIHRNLRSPRSVRGNRRQHVRVLPAGALGLRNPGLPAVCVRCRFDAAGLPARRAQARETCPTRTAPLPAEEARARVWRRRCGRDGRARHEEACRLSAGWIHRR